MTYKPENNLTENKLMAAKEEERGEIRSLGLTHTRPCVKHTNSEELPYTTGNSSQRPVIT